MVSKAKVKEEALKKKEGCGVETGNWSFGLWVDITPRDEIENVICNAKNGHSAFVSDFSFGFSYRLGFFEMKYLDHMLSLSWP